MLLAADDSSAQGFNPMYILLLLILVVFVVFSFRNNRKRRKDADDLKAQLVPGAHVMTQFGLYGTIVSIDEDANRVVLEVSPGTTLTVHRQAVTTVVPEPSTDTDTATEAPPADAEPSLPDAADADEPASAPSDSADGGTEEPEFGKKSKD